jgi:Pectate lyase superfamily protein
MMRLPAAIILVITIATDAHPARPLGPVRPPIRLRAVVAPPRAPTHLVAAVNQPPAAAVGLNIVGSPHPTSALPQSTLTLTWTNSTARSDGTLLPASQISSVQIFDNGSQVASCPNACTNYITGALTTGSHLFAVRALDRSTPPSPSTLSVAVSISIASPPLTLPASVIPADRNFAWNPGMTSQGGIPNRTAVCATLAPLGGSRDDSAQINKAIATCPVGQVVMLSAGTFINNNLILINKGITLRGAGAGVTILNKTNGVVPRTNTLTPGTSDIYMPIGPTTYKYDPQPNIVVGPKRWPHNNDGVSIDLTSDGAQGSNSITVANAGNLAAGEFVLLDELSGASWKPVPAGFGCGDSIAPTPCPPFVWQGDRVAWNMHWPVQQYRDDNPHSDSSGPYQTTPGTIPVAMSWFSRPDRAISEIKEIASITGRTITFTSPITIAYRTGHAAQIASYPAQIKNAGVEALTVLGGGDGAIRFEAAAYSWAKNVEVTQWLGEAIAIDNSFRIELRDSYLHTGTWPEPGGGGYALSLASGSSEALIENNILRDVNKVMVFRSSGAGSVVAYNYADDGWIFTVPTWAEVGINASHMAGPHHVLFEGNWSFNADSDYTHGNSIYITFFRNWLTGQRTSFTGPGAADAYHRTAGINYGAWWFSFIGNILGRPGQMSGWAYTHPSMACDAEGNNCTGNPAGPVNSNNGTAHIWIAGYDQLRWQMHPDPKVLSTIIRDGNYDYLTNSQRWHNTRNGFTIPNSMYLSSKPAFFGPYPWPWVDPTTGTVYTLPAKSRYDAGRPNIVP